MRVTTRLGALIGMASSLSIVVALGAPAGAVAKRSHSHVASLPTAGTPSLPVRSLPIPLYGVTVDSVANLSAIVAGSETLRNMPITRVYFNVKEPASYYAATVRGLHPVSYVMGELLDSSDSRRIATASYHKHVQSYVATLASSVDVWEIGNEVNGNWTGRYSKVEAKLTDAYDDVTSAGGRSALTLYYNVGCGDGPKELDPIAFSQRYVPNPVRQGLDYVLLSYYEGDCNGIRPTAATWTAYFTRLHALYPHALVGFGEVGMDRPATVATLATAESIMRSYYGLDINLPYYVGGYFWWYYDEDCLPLATSSLGSALQAAFSAESAALSP